MNPQSVIYLLIHIINKPSPEIYDILVNKVRRFRLVYRYRDKSEVV